MEVYEKVKEFPQVPGVYLMKNKGKIIYIGKAKNLKNRVTSYFNREHDSDKTKELVKHIEEIDYIICKSEVDALILENNLIKRHLPKYNIMLKDEKTYPYIKITKEKFPKLSVIRSTKYLQSKNAVYFGPYPHGVYNFIKILKKIFPIRDCSRDMERVYDRPCLKYHMKMCIGPCIYKNVVEEYNSNVQKIISFLKGDFKDILKEYKQEMVLASEEMEFERAISFREKIKEIERIGIGQISELGKAVDEDVFVFKVENKRLFVCVLTIRDGKLLGKSSMNQQIDELFQEELFMNIVSMYYEKHPLPKNLIFEEGFEGYEEFVTEWITRTKEKKVNLFFPKIKSRKKELLEMALLNLEKDMEKYFTSKKVLEEGLIKLYKTLELKRYPRRIECFDISNIQGSDAVGSMTVAIDGKLTKSEYRKFKIRGKSTPDDFEMMREVMKRRYSKLEEDEFPELLLIDGGKGQINAVGQTLYEIGVHEKVEVISIAKREEEIFKLGESEPYIFDKRGETLKILQRLRDEAHRFGITYHRKLRSKRVISSELDNIQGIGKKRKEVLLKKFKSVKRIREASLEALKEVLPENVAIEVKKKLKGDE